MATYYVSQTESGAADGSTPTDAISIATFNSSASGGAGGNTYYFLGTITTGVNCPSGSAGNVITVRGDYTGTPGYIIVSSGSAWKCTGGARSYYQIQNLYLETTAADDAIYTNGSSYVIDGCTIKSALTCIEISNARSADSITITDNVLIPGSAASADCVLWQASDDAYNLTNLTISGNTISGAGRYGIDIRNTGVAGCSNWIITSNVVTNCVNVGIRLNVEGTTDTVTGVKVNSNTVTGCSGGFAAHAISGEVLGNSFCGNTGVTGGIDLFSSTSVMVRNNRCNDNVSAAADGNGILIDWDQVAVRYCENITCIANECSRNIGNSGTANSGCGIMVLASTGTRLEGNYGEGNRNGLWFGGPAVAMSTCAVYNNWFMSNLANGVMVKSTIGAGEITLYNNLVSGGASGYGFNLEAAGNQQVANYNAYYGWATAYLTQTGGANDVVSSSALSGNPSVSGAGVLVIGSLASDDLPLPLHPDIGLQDRNAPDRRFGIGGGSL